jgi:hypothetical protein
MVPRLLFHSNRRSKLTEGTGSSWVNIYTTYFLTIAGVENAFAMSVMITCIGLIGCIFSLGFTRYIDRRVVIIIGCGACALCQLFMAVVWTVHPGSKVAGKCVVAFISLFTFFYVAYCKLHSVLI